MPRSVNEVHIAGHAGKDAEIKYSSSGLAIANFSIATGGGKKKDGSGEWPTEWHNIVVFGNLAEDCVSVKKGVFVDVVKGRIQTRSWEDKRSGEKRYRTEIVASELLIGETSHMQQRPLTPQPVSAKVEPYSQEITDDDIPF